MFHLIELWWKSDARVQSGRQMARADENKTSSPSSCHMEMDSFRLCSGIPFLLFICLVITWQSGKKTHYLFHLEGFQWFLINFVPTWTFWILSRQLQRRRWALRKVSRPLVGSQTGTGGSLWWGWKLPIHALHLNKTRWAPFPCQVRLSPRA